MLPCWIKTNLAATNNQHLLILHLPGEDQRASALDFGVLVMRHYAAICDIVDCGCSKDFQTLASLVLLLTLCLSGRSRRKAIGCTSADTCETHVMARTSRAERASNLSNLSRGSYTTGRHLAPTPHVPKLRPRYQPAACEQSLYGLNHHKEYLS